MTGEEIRQLGDDELDAKENEIREQIFRLRFQLQMGQADGLGKYRGCKKDLARILTVRRERELKQGA